MEELRKDVKERKVTIRVEKLKVRSCEVKELKRREVMNNKSDAKWLQAGAYTHTQKKPEAEVETGKVKSRTSEEKESFLNSLVTVLCCPSDLGDVGLGDSSLGFGGDGSSSRSYEKRWKGEWGR